MSNGLPSRVVLLLVIVMVHEESADSGRSTKSRLCSLSELCMLAAVQHESVNCPQQQPKTKNCRHSLTARQSWKHCSTTHARSVASSRSVSRHCTIATQRVRFVHSLPLSLRLQRRNPELSMKKQQTADNLLNWRFAGRDHSHFDSATDCFRALSHSST